MVDKRNTASGSGLTAYTRDLHFSEIFELFFGAGGDGVLIWHYTNLFDDNNYNIKPDGVHTGGNANSNDNDDDTDLLSIILRKGKQLSSGGKSISRNRSVTRRTK